MVKILLVFVVVILVTLLLYFITTPAFAADTLADFIISADSDNATFEYMITNTHLPTDTHTSKSGIIVNINERIHIINFLRTITPSNESPENSINALGGGGTSLYLTITVSDGTKLYIENICDFYRYTITTPSGRDFTSTFTCNPNHLLSFFIAHECNN